MIKMSQTINITLQTMQQIVSIKQKRMNKMYSDNHDIYDNNNISNINLDLSLSNVKPDNWSD